jgi:uncharacterized membrane protein YqiK
LRDGERLTGLGMIVGVAVTALMFFGTIAAFGWVTSFKGTDTAEVCVVKEGGWFDGKDIKEVRAPGQGPKPIGAWNDQYCYPTSERDLTDEVDALSVPSQDGIDMVIQGQALFKLKEDPALVEEFHRKYGTRKWDGESLWDDAGWDNFLRIRLVPILQDTLRQTIGQYECAELRNTCVYVIQAEALAGDAEKVQEEAAKQNNQLAIQRAQDQISEVLVEKFNTGLGGEYFESIRFQNLKPDLPKELQAKVTQAQAKKAEVATARLEADRAFEAAQGQRRAKEEEAQGLRAYAQALRDPGIAQVERIKALCGVTADDKPKGCANLQVLGPNSLVGIR